MNNTGALLSKINDNLRSDYKRLTDILSLIAEYEGGNDIRPVAEKLRQVNEKRQIYLWCYESRNGRDLVHCQRELFDISKASSKDIQTINGIKSYTVQNCDTRTFEPVYVGDTWVEFLSFAHYIYDLYSTLDSMDEIEGFHDFLHSCWPPAAKELREIIDRGSKTPLPADIDKPLGTRAESGYLLTIACLVKALADKGGNVLGDSTTPNHQKIAELIRQYAVDEDGCALQGMSDSAVRKRLAKAIELHSDKI
jgi:hypothetical protein